MRFEKEVQDTPASVWEERPLFVIQINVETVNATIKSPKIEVSEVACDTDLIDLIMMDPIEINISGVHAGNRSRKRNTNQRAISVIYPPVEMSGKTRKL